MSARGPATPGETERACPYCRSPLKGDVDVARCPECASTHHAECWDENLGCAIVACAGGPKPAAGAPSGKPGPGKPPPEEPPAGPSRPSPRAPPRGVLIGGVAAAALVAIIIVIGVASGGGESQSSAGAALRDGPRKTAAPLYVPTEQAAETPTEAPTAVSTGLDEEATISAIADLLLRSMDGRQAALNGDYETAIAARQDVLDALVLLDTVEAGDVRSLLADAMQASIDASNARYECGDCAIEYDDAATASKQDLVDTYNEYAEYYGIVTFSADEI